MDAAAGRVAGGSLHVQSFRLGDEVEILHGGLVAGGVLPVHQRSCRAAHAPLPRGVWRRRHQSEAWVGVGNGVAVAIAPKFMLIELDKIKLVARPGLLNERMDPSGRVDGVFGGGDDLHAHRRADAVGSRKGAPATSYCGGVGSVTLAAGRQIARAWGIGFEVKEAAGLRVGQKRVAKTLARGGGIDHQVRARRPPTGASTTRTRHWGCTAAKILVCRLTPRDHQQWHIWRAYNDSAVGGRAAIWFGGRDNAHRPRLWAINRTHQR